MAVTSQTYLDLRTPAITAGATMNRRGLWSMPNDNRDYCCVAELCREHAIEPVRMEPPKVRTMRAIEKASRKIRAYPAPDRDSYTRKALEYMTWKLGAEPDRVIWENKRIRYVTLRGKKHEIPHWDFEPTIEQIA